MALDDLQAVIEKLRDVAQSQHDYISRHETRTRQVLIDPLLEALGWVVSDPNLVELEYSAGGGRADYALKSNARVIAVIEAKSLGKSLEQKELEQVLQYAVGRGIPYMGVTNGDEWRMYDVFEAKPIEEKIIMQFRLSGTSSHEVALKSLLMWCPNMTSGSAPVDANHPAFDAPGSDDQPQNHEEFQSTQTDSFEVSAPEDEGWVTLDNVGFQTHDPWPRQMIMPGGEPEECKNYRALWTKVANWLLENQNHQEWAEFFDEFVGGAQNELPPKSSPRQLSNGIWIKRNYSTPVHGKNIKAALKHFGVDLGSVRLRFD